jgi:hypothetical protein
MAIESLSINVTDIVADQERPVSSERARWTQLETWAASVKNSCLVPDASGVVTLEGNLDVDDNKITTVGTPENSGDAATKGYVDSAISSPSYTTNIDFTVVQDVIDIDYSDGYDDWKTIPGTDVTITPAAGSHVRITACITGDTENTSDVMYLTLGRQVSGEASYSTLAGCRGTQDADEEEVSAAMFGSFSTIMIDFIDEDAGSDFSPDTEIKYILMAKMDGSGQKGWLNRDYRDDLRSITTIIAEELVLS